MSQRSKAIGILGSILFLLVAILLVGGVAINVYVRKTTQDYIMPSTQLHEMVAGSIEKPECIVVYGARVFEDGRPSLMLEHRLQTALDLYRLGVAPNILVSGDHKSTEFNEVIAMRDWLMARGVPKSAIVCDLHGYTTYETSYRARHVFQVRRAILVTQRYHLPRALYDSRALGITAYGVASGGGTYPGQNQRDFREVLAVIKDYFLCIAQPKPDHLEGPTPLS